MTLPSVVIAVDTVSTVDIIRFLEQKTGVVFENGRASLGKCFEFVVVDVSDAVAYAAKFLSANDLEDQNPVWNRLNSMDFNIEIRVRCDRVHLGINSREIFGEEIAIAVSKELGVTAVYSIENGDIPFGIYREGRKEVGFPEYYRRSLKGRTWLPTENAEQRDGVI